MKIKQDTHVTTKWTRVDDETPYLTITLGPDDCADLIREVLTLKGSAKRYASTATLTRITRAAQDLRDGRL